MTTNTSCMPKRWSTDYKDSERIFCNLKLKNKMTRKIKKMEEPNQRTINTSNFYYSMWNNIILWGSGNPSNVYSNWQIQIKWRCKNHQEEKSNQTISFTIVCQITGIIGTVQTPQMQDTNFKNQKKCLPLLSTHQTNRFYSCVNNVNGTYLNCK
jgi:hypothetical protein